MPVRLFVPFVYQPITRHPPDAFTLVFFGAAFVALTLATMRRPAIGLCALIATVPFAFYNDVFGTTLTLPKVTLLAVLLGLWYHERAFAALARPAALRLLFAGALVLAATVLSGWHAENHVAVVRESFKMLEYLLLFTAAVAAYNLDPQDRWIRWTVFATVIVVCLGALAQEIVGAPSGMFVQGHVVPRIAGTLEGPNQLAGYIDVALPLVLVLALEERTALASITMGMLLCTDVLTFSRGGWIGASIALAIVAFVRRKRMLRLVPGILTGLASGAAVVLAWALFTHSSTSILRLPAGAPEPSYGGGVGTRAELWRAAFTLWREHPFFGVGAGNFQLDIPMTGLHGVRTHANSLYIQALVEGGIPLFAATLYLVYLSIATFIRRRLDSPFALAALAGSAALAIHQIVDLLVFYPKVGAEWWIVLALGAAGIAATGAPQKTRASGPPGNP